MESSYYEETTGGEMIEEHGYHTVEINTDGIHAMGHELSFNVTEYNETKGVALSCTNFYPNNLIDLQSSNSSYKWRNIYATNGTIQTSDRTKKTHINSLEIQKVKVIRYKDENGKKLENPIEEVIEDEYDYALRYDEFIAPLIKVVQEQQKMIEQQQIAIKNQQKEIEQIKKELSKMDSSI